MEDIKNYDISTIPSSSYNIWIAKRRSGKSVLCEYLIHQMVGANMVD